MGIFTREQEELLTYDGDAFFYFAGTMLLTMLLPWTWVLARQFLWPVLPKEVDYTVPGPGAPRHARMRHCATAAMEQKRRMSVASTQLWRVRLGGSTGILQHVVVFWLWVCLGAVLWRLKDTPPELRTFDPYAILGVQHGAELKDIKRAYRQKSLQHHPDKDRDNPMAPVMFQEITKAYAAFTDEGARMNYEKYGNPDGPAQMKVGIALHPIMLMTKETQRTTLMIFFSIIILVPLSVVCCCLWGNNLSTGGVCAETLRIYNACIDSEVRGEDGPGFIAASIESRLVFLADLRSLIMAMTAAEPQPIKPGVIVEVGSAGGELSGRRGVFRRAVSELCCEVEVWPTQSPPQSSDEVDVRELPRLCLQACNPRVSCPFSDSGIWRNAALLWAHMWRLHADMGPAARAEVNILLHYSARLGRAMTSIAARSCQGDRMGSLTAVEGMLTFRRCLVQALDIDSSPLRQLPHVTSVPKKDAPTLRELVESGGDDKLLSCFGLTPEQRMDVRAFCAHAPRVKLECRVEVPDESDIAHGDLAALHVTLVRTNLEEGEYAGPVHAPYFPGPKFEEWWLIVYNESDRRLMATDAIGGTGHRESTKIHFMVPRAGDFRWTVHARCDSYAGLDVVCEVNFHAKKHGEVSHDARVHPQDVDIKSFFEELMEALQPPDMDESDSEEDEPAKKPPQLPAQQQPAEAAAAAAAAATDVAGPTKKGEDSDDDGDKDDAEPEGVFYKTFEPTGTLIYRCPREDQSVCLGTIPEGATVRGFTEGRPDGWLELSPTGGAWLRVDPGEGRWFRARGEDGAIVWWNIRVGETRSTAPEDADLDAPELVARDGWMRYVDQKTREPYYHCAESDTTASAPPEVWAKAEAEAAAGGVSWRPSKMPQCLGALCAQQLRTVVQTHTPLSFVRRWARKSTLEVTVQDMLCVRDMSDMRVQMMVEDIMRTYLGKDRIESLLDEVQALTTRQRNRLTPALGIFNCNRNGIVWQVTAEGAVRGLHNDGSRIRYRVDITDDDKLRIGPFILDESRTCSCKHWVQKDDPNRSWVWVRDKTLQTRVRLGTAF